MKTKEDRLKELASYLTENGYNIESVDDYTEHKLSILKTKLYFLAIIISIIEIFAFLLTK